MQKVFLIEDSKIVKILHERALTRAGYQVVSAADGEEALKVAAGVAPDVILLDMMLPKISGPEVLRSLKQNPATAHIPVIVLTALSRKNEEKLLREGADAFLGKAELVDSTAPLVDLVKRVVQERKIPQPQPFRADAMNWILNEIEAGAVTRI